MNAELFIKGLLLVGGDLGVESPQEQCPSTPLKIGEKRRLNGAPLEGICERHRLPGGNEHAICWPAQVLGQTADLCADQRATRPCCARRLPVAEPGCRRGLCRR